MVTECTHSVDFLCGRSLDILCAHSVWVLFGYSVWTLSGDILRGYSLWTFCEPILCVTWVVGLSHSPGWLARLSDWVGWPSWLA